RRGPEHEPRAPGERTDRGRQQRIDGQRIPACRRRRRSARGPVHGCVDGDHGPHERPAGVLRTARRGRAGRVHAPGVRQHVCAADAGGPGPGGSRAPLRPGAPGPGRSRLGAARRVGVYTHGHADHAFGLRSWLEHGERPEIVAQERCVARFHRYRLMHGLNAHINQRQFSLPRPTFPEHFDWPTLLVRERLTQMLGDVELQYTAARGETDDHLWVWVPSHRYLFTGDLIIWQAPNCGNPQKVQRYPEDWADALETMAGLDAEWLFPGHGLAVQGREAVRRVLSETARYL